MSGSGLREKSEVLEYLYMHLHTPFGSERHPEYETVLSVIAAVAASIDSANGDIGKTALVCSSLKSSAWWSCVYVLRKGGAAVSKCWDGLKRREFRGG